ncbi:MAG TPA: V-type ATP synthase subunit A [Woeseiaceae bacterium]|nr:V-type ATP synthase subunit A [Woeseiaceae bacterium]
MSVATIQWIGGPVLRARMQQPFHVQEAIHVGPDKLLGEVIQLRGDVFTAQVYERTSGLKPGDRIEGTGRALSVGLGPHLLGQIFDGLLRPLGDEDELFVRAGMTAQGAETRRYAFDPAVAAGDEVEPGQSIGRAGEKAHAVECLVPAGAGGRVAEVAEAGEYGLEDVVCRIEPDGRNGGNSIEIRLSQHWPVRRPRPVAQRLPVGAPLITGQRILDTLFPIARGGRGMLPGGFGTGKTILQEALAKWCDADVIVYVGCGERGNEMAEVLDELPKLEDPRTGRPLMERTVIIANTSNMPVAAREASIYTGITVAEYFRDQGRHVALMADSTSRWAEALREVSGRLGELPAESGYPAYLSSRLADFYERAARVKTLGGEEGSVTIIGAVSPPASDFSEPVTMHTKRYVRCFWALDRERAQARFYPAVHPLHSYSEDAVELARWWKSQGDPDWDRKRQRVLVLLEEQQSLERMARIIGKDALPPVHQVTLLNAELVNDGFLRQSSFSETDRYCSPARQQAMLDLLLKFITLAEQALEAGASPADIAAVPSLARLRRLGEEVGEDELEKIDELRRQVEAEFHELEEGGGDGDERAAATREEAVAEVEGHGQDNDEASDEGIDNGS